MRIGVKVTMPEKKMNLRATAQWIGLLIAILLLQACTQVPRQDLDVYQSAFADTAETGVALYQEAAKVLRDVEAAKAKAQATVGGKPVKIIGAPVAFDPQDVATSSDPVLELPATIRVRVLALETVLAYNDALVAHVSGDPLDRIKRPIAAAEQRLMGFTGLVAGLTDTARVDLTGAVTGKIADLVIDANPFVGLALAGLKQLIGLGLKEKAAIEFHKALIAAHGDIDNVLDLLEKDTASLYGFAKIRCALVRQTGIKRLRDDAVLPMRAIAVAFKRPTDPPLLADVIALEQGMDEAVVGIFQPGTVFDPCGSGEPTTYDVTKVKRFSGGGYPFAFNFTIDGNAKQPDTAAVGVLASLVANYEIVAGEMVATQQRLLRYHGQLLPNYVALIRSARDGLRTLKESAVQGSTFDAAGLMRLGAVIRANVEGVKRAVEASGPVTP